VKRQQIIRNADTGELEIVWLDLGPSRIPRRPRPPSSGRRRRDANEGRNADLDKPRYLVRSGRTSSKADRYQQRAYS
jgi:hypothetical protein